MARLVRLAGGFISRYNILVNPIRQVAKPPPKPLMIYDGDCAFCKFWIGRWQRTTLDHVDYLPFQDLRVGLQYPEIPRAQFETAVQLIEPTGVVYQSAEAIFRSLAFNPQRRQWWRYYESSRFFASASEWSYRFIARHRALGFFLTRMFWRVKET